MEELPEKYQHLLNPGEQVIYHENIGNNPNRIGLLFLALIMLLASFFNLSQGSKDGIIPSILLLGIAICIISYYFISGDFYFIATTGGIRINNNIFKSFAYIPYSRIYKMSTNEGIASRNLSLHQVYPIKKYSDNNKNDSHTSISGLNNPKKVIEKISENWLLNSPYQELNKKLRSVANKYELNFTPFEAIDGSSASLSGSINGMKISLILGTIYNISNLRISIQCPNEEDNYLLIQDEKLYSGFQKAFGKQDLKIGNLALDNYFIFQSNNTTFFEDVMMDEEVKREIPKAWKTLNGTLIMGKPKKIEKSKSNKSTDLEILDSHLLNELSNKIDRKEGFTSSLTYESKNISSMGNRFIQIGTEIDIILDTIILIAQRIKAYNNK